MNFERYMSLKRFGNIEVEGIENGKCYIFPKLDGTNASCWMSEKGEICAGSRNRELDEASNGDNAGFCKWVRQDERIKACLTENPQLRLFGEFLVPHSIKNYIDTAWKRFFVFDVYDHVQCRLLKYDEYIKILERYNIEYIPVWSIVENPTAEKLKEVMLSNTYLMKDNGIGEGIVIKNYSYKNKYYRVVWAKMVTDEFKEVHRETFGGENQEIESIEQKIVNVFLTNAFIEKEYNKLLLALENEGRVWTNKCIPELLGRIYKEFIDEECFNFIKKFKAPIVNFKKLNGLAMKKVKSTLTDIF